MSNKKLTKADEKMLKSYADKLQPIWQTAQEKIRVPGYELISEGKKEVDGKPIAPMGLYIRSKSVQVRVNHYRRLRDAWIRDGQEGIEKYLIFYKGIIDKANIQNKLQHAEN